MLPANGNLTAWETIVKELVSRYGGTVSNYGCVENNKKDCYVKNDGLYPDSAVRKAIAQRPVKNWEIENEWLNNIKDPNNPSQPANDQDMVSYFIAIRNVIRQIQPDAKIILAPDACIDCSAAVDGYSSNGVVGWGDPDCLYSKDYVDEKGSGSIQSIAVSDSQREKYFIVNLAPYYNVVDFHDYSNDPYEINYSVQWLQKILSDNNISEKEIWSTENAGPFNYFVVMGKPQPKCPDPKTCKGSPMSLAQCTTTYFDPEIQSKQLVQRYVINVANGVGKVFSEGAIWPFTGWSDNYVRNSLLDSNGKKPAYYTAKLMNEKLSGAISVEKIADYVYEFKFKTKSPVFVAWSDTPKTIDLTEQFKIWLNSPRLLSATITHIITNGSRTDKNPPIQTLLENNIQISSDPVFIEIQNF